MENLVLVTGFEPFGEDKVNPSEQIVERLMRDSALKRRLEGIELVGAVLPVSRRRSIWELEKIYDSHVFALAVHLGQAGGTAAITVERFAANVLDFNQPDNDGELAADERITDSVDGYMTRINVKGLVEFLNKKGIPAVISYTAGQFICNEVYFHSLHRARTVGNPGDALFVHLPFLPEQVAMRFPKNRNIPSMSLETQYRAVAWLLKWLATSLQFEPFKRCLANPVHSHSIEKSVSGTPQHPARLPFEVRSEEIPP